MAKGLYKRIGWLMLALLFIVTALGVGVVTFWEATHQPKASKPTTANTCTIQQVTTNAVLPKPEAYKPTGEVKSLQITDLESGNGTKVKAGDCLTVKYQGTLTNGTEFDGNFDKPYTLKFKVGQGQVIAGWDQGLLGMNVGGTRRLIIPPSLGYGSQSQSAIPANSTLVFVVKVLTIEQ
jgi:FKBP-type peptidyl-prolyl cis-trans isomerase